MSAFGPKRTFAERPLAPLAVAHSPFLRHAAGISSYVREGRFMDQLKHIKKSVVIKRSIIINRHKTSVSLENEFWDGLHEVARDEHTTAPMLVEQIDRSSDNCNLSSAIRLFVFNRLRRGK
jgi:predicted DNA-binding ribbon-helix-helix protein